jgi:hypothetical protein
MDPLVPFGGPFDCYGEVVASCDRKQNLKTPAMRTCQVGGESWTPLSVFSIA